MVQPDERTAAPGDQQQPPPEQPAQQPPQPPAPQQPAGQQEPQPDGAYARFATSDGSAEAWLRTDEGNDPVGYVRENTDPPRTVRYTNPAHWAEDVDQRSMQRTDGGDQPAATGNEQGQSVDEVTEALQALANGERTLDDVAEFFREREWPRRTSADDQTPGSFAVVADAYSRGDISHDQYVALAQAATDAMREQSGMGDTSEQQ